MWFSLIRGDTLRLMPSYCICVSLLLSLCFLYIAFSSFHSFLPPSPPLSCNQFFCRSLMCNACRQFSPASSIVSLQTRPCLVLHAAHCVPCPTVKGNNSSCTFSHILKKQLSDHTSSHSSWQAPLGWERWCQLLLLKWGCVKVLIDLGAIWTPLVQPNWFLYFSNSSLSWHR